MDKSKIIEALLQILIDDCKVHEHRGCDCKAPENHDCWIAVATAQYEKLKELKVLK